MIRFIPSRATIWAIITGAMALILALARRDARKNQQTKSQIEDYEHAQDISDNVSRSRADPDRLRPFEGHGYRD